MLPAVFDSFKRRVGPASFFGGGCRYAGLWRAFSFADKEHARGVRT